MSLLERVYCYVSFIRYEFIWMTKLINIHLSRINITIIIIEIIILTLTILIYNNNRLHFI